MGVRLPPLAPDQGRQGAHEPKSWKAGSEREPAILPEEAGKLWAIWLGRRGLLAAESTHGSLSEKILAEEGSYSFLCQPDGRKSWGGCCDDFRQSRSWLGAKYRLRRSSYLTRVKTTRDLPSYRLRVREKYPDDSSCPYLAFLDEEEKTIGCLLHPGRAENQGRISETMADMANICAGATLGLLAKLWLGQKAAGEPCCTGSRMAPTGSITSVFFSPSVSYRSSRGLIEIYFLLLDNPRPVPQDRLLITA